MSSWSYNWLSWVVHEKMLSKMLVFNWLMFLLYFLPLSSATASPDYVKAGCDGRCGTVSIPYPFGIRKHDCALNKDFFLNCRRNNTAEELFYGKNIPVRDISVLEGTIIIRSDAVYACYDKSRMETEDSGWAWTINLGSSRFTFSDSQNKFIAIGCDTLAWLTDLEVTIGTACLSLCSQRVNLSEKCLDSGCCQTSIPKGLHSLQYYLRSQNNYTDVYDFNRCGYAFLADKRSFNFSDWRLSVTPEAKNTDVVVEWVVENKTCQQAKANTSAYACGNNTACDDNDQGYRCKCKEGFEGNPYLPLGCEDIDECADPQRNHCTGKGKCKNTPGNYTCTCPIGMHVDGRTCQGFGITTIASVIGAGISLVVIVVLLYIILIQIRKEKNFRENGGTVLKHQRVRIFTEAELAKATNNYDDRQKLGEGGFGCVYKGVLPDNTQLAVKKFKGVDKAQMNEEFQHEIGMVLQVNHKNVVKLLGLCLQTKVPLLVYEFISNGTLYHHIHDKRSQVLRTWKNRLRVAAETALALDYLHSLANPPIIHGDIKTVNILLDEDCTAKIADFGASALISKGQSDIATKIQGTFGYLDPEYLMTGILTVKSDVFSFGVVLVELLTGQKPNSNAKSVEKRNVVQDFISSLENNQLYKILDFEISDEEMEEIEVVAELAKRSLDISGEKRPSMKEVSDELARLKALNDDLWGQQNSEETEHLLGKSSLSFHQDTSPSMNEPQMSQTVISLELETYTNSI